MDIFRRLGSGLSKLSVRKKSSSKSKSLKSDGLTYNSPFGSSFRHDPDHDLRFLSFVSPEPAFIRSLDVSPNDCDDVDDSDSSFDKPFLDQTFMDDPGDRSQPKFRTDWKPVNGKGDRRRDSENHKEKRCRAVAKDNETDDLESLSDNQQLLAGGIKSQQRLKTSLQSSYLKPGNSTEKGNHLGLKFRPESNTNLRDSNTKGRTDTGTSLLNGNLDSLKYSIEEVIDSGLRFESPTRDRSKSLHVSLHSSASAQNQQGRNSRRNSRGVPELDAWNVAHVDRHCVGQSVSTLCDSLDSISGDQDSPLIHSEEAERVGKKKTLRRRRRRRSSSLSDIDTYKKRQMHGINSPDANKSSEEDDPITQEFPSDHQRIEYCQQNSGFEKSVGGKLSTPLLGRRPSELRNRRIAVMMCPRPYGYKPRAHDNQSPFRFSDYKSPSCNAEESQQIRPCTTKESDVYTFNGLPNAAVDECGGDEIWHPSHSKSERDNSSAVNTLTLAVDTAESIASGISGRESSEQVEQTIPTRKNVQDSAPINWPDMYERMFESLDPRMVTSKPSLTSISRDRGINGGHSLYNSVHGNFETQVQQTAKPLDSWWRKYPGLDDEIKSSEADKMTSLPPILTDDLPLEKAPPMSSVTMAYPHTQGHYSLQPRLSQVSAAQENVLNLEQPFLNSARIICSTEAILKQSRKGWNNWSNDKNLD